LPPDIIVVTTVLLLYAAVVISPGPNFALISRLAISGAKQTAVGATLGLACAATFYAVLSMSGLAVVLARIGWLAGAVQVAGGLFLVYLGIASWVRPKVQGGAETTPLEGDDLKRGIGLGLLVNLGNPKGIAFFISLYAATIPLGTALSSKIMILMGGFALELLWYGLVLTLLSSGPARRVYSKAGDWIERCIGAVLIGFGLKLIFAPKG